MAAKKAQMMPTFAYDGVDRKGIKVKGELPARNMALAKVMLRKQGITIKTIREKKKNIFEGLMKKGISTLDITILGPLISVRSSIYTFPSSASFLNFLKLGVNKKVSPSNNIPGLPKSSVTLVNLYEYITLPLPVFHNLSSSEFSLSIIKFAFGSRSNGLLFI